MLMCPSPCHIVIDFRLFTLIRRVKGPGYTLCEHVMEGRCDQLEQIWKTSNLGLALLVFRQWETSAPGNEYSCALNEIGSLCMRDERYTRTR